MKKRVLFFACLCMLFSLSSKAQELTYKATGPATASSTEVTTGTSTENNIKLDYETTGIVADGSSGYFYYTLNNSTRHLTLTSTNTQNIVKVSVQYRGTGNSSLSGLTLSYGADASNIVGTLTHAMSVGASAPGVLAEFTIPDGGAKYVQIKRTSSTARFYYIAAGFTAYTLPTDYLTLPLDLLSFSAKPDAFGKSVNLSWKTANEVNTQDFLVERRTDDTEFTTVGTVLSKNVAGTHSYSFTDVKPASGNSYYRLKQRDRDGEFTYSDIANVKIEGIALSIYPNPVSKELVVNHDYLKQSALLKVIGLDGKTHIKTTSAVGSSSTTINVASLASGTYLLVHDVNGKPQSQKFIKK
ncbi:MAG: T9SS type A sorting domain-containing protein [Pedobacter sp.]|uniref:T9SS type A sorting domain-containing protein n=1 Tax=Pedobacter sp. TaxID=1411316 RepID=UPI0028077447|nr:T9SS type A sorting domain-containing protein [Pedobacter sp.]MDQ8004395.1 T9SS type A sorting domain-containing protein [Pedobacter sp.]